METLLKKPEILRDSDGRFERHGKALAKTAKKGEITVAGVDSTQKVDGRIHNGRKKGVPNKVTAQLKEMVLQALSNVGGVSYLEKLAVENSSAFSSLLKAVLPSTLTPETSGGKTVITFKRVIVFPEGQQPAAASHTLPRNDVIEVEAKEIK